MTPDEAAAMEHFNPRSRAELEGEEDTGAVPQLVVTLGRAGAATRVITELLKGQRQIHVDPARRARNQIVINPMCMAAEDARIAGTSSRSTSRTSRLYSS